MVHSDALGCFNLLQQLILSRLEVICFHLNLVLECLVGALGIVNFALELSQL